MHFLGGHLDNDSKGNEKLESESERGSWNVEQNAGFTCDRLGNRPEQPNLPNLLPSVSIQIGIHCRKSTGKLIETRTKLLWDFGHALKCLMRFQKHLRGYGAYCSITNCMSWFPNKPTYVFDPVCCLSATGLSLVKKPGLRAFVNSQRDLRTAAAACRNPRFHSGLE